ncbi:MAG: BlaI/MecI/CopY family transcriptional regulator [archaeon]|nr:BlaI/MecI/CopY family transcriptional regulator [archaeon]
MDTEPFEEIGLTNAEVKIYVALLELGNSGAGQILERTGLHNSVVHMTLNRLIEKGLVSYVKEGKHHTYQASNPRHILDFIDQKRQSMEKILPELLAKEKMSQTKPEVTTFRGTRGVKELLFELLDAGGKWHYTIGSPIESVAMGDAFWTDFHQRRAKKGIQARIVFNESLREWAKKTRKKSFYPKAEIRYLEKGFEPLTETIVRNDKVGILLWTQKPTGILLHNKVLAESYERYFQFVWKNAKP